MDIKRKIHFGVYPFYDICMEFSGSDSGGGSIIRDITGNVRMTWNIYGTEIIPPN